MDDKKKKELAIRSSAAEYLIFVASTGESDASYEMRYEDENIWLTQKMMAALYDVDVRTVNEHIKKIYADGELTEQVTIRKFRIVQTEGTRQVNRELTHYNLQMIIAVGFKVNNQRAVQFRKWAGQIVKEHTIQGWTMDVERLKKGHMFTDEYFERQLQQIREIRLSERKFYQKVTDLYATAFDYDKDAKTTRLFFQTVQNKMHYAVHRHTAAELIVERADANKEHMGLTTWENAPDGKILKADVTVAKNYLSKEEMNYLERIAHKPLVVSKNARLSGYEIAECQMNDTVEAEHPELRKWLSTLLDSTRSQSRLCDFWMNAQQLERVNSLQPRELLLTSAGREEVHETVAAVLWPILTSTPVCLISDGGHSMPEGIRQIAGSDFLRRRRYSLVPNTRTPFYDFSGSGDLVLPNIGWRPCFATDRGIILAMSMKRSVFKLDDGPVQLGMRARTRGRRLPGFYLNPPLSNGIAGATLSTP